MLSAAFTTSPPAKTGGWAFDLMIKICFSFFLIVSFSPPAIADSSGLGLRLDSLLTDSLLTDAHIGLCLFDISSDSLVYSRDADELFIPASNLKLFTSAAALELLGPGFRFKTGFSRNGKLSRSGELNGDLIITGGGDPLISGRFRSHITEVLECWADSLLAVGIRKISGEIIVDNSYFSPPELGPGWSWDDLSYWYACPISALSYNDNCIDLKFLPGKAVGDPALIEISPRTDYITIHNLATTLPAGSSFTLDYYRIPHTNDITFFGGIPINDTSETDYVSVDKPEIFAATIFGDILNARGVKFKGGIISLSYLNEKEKSHYNRNKLSPIFVWQSDSLGAIIKVINTNSQNFFAEQVLKTLGAEKAGVGNFRAGIKAASTFFESIGISGKDVIMVDGSGLSYMNLVKPKAVTRLLSYMSRSPNFDLYLNSMANPAKDKSLRKRLQNLPDRENIWAKTGFISNASTFSGYWRDSAAGHLVAFSIMINNYSCPTAYAEAWEDSVVAAISRWF